MILGEEEKVVAHQPNQQRSYIVPRTTGHCSISCRQQRYMVCMDAESEDVHIEEPTGYTLLNKIYSRRDSDVRFRHQETY